MNRFAKVFKVIKNDFFQIRIDSSLFDIEV